VAAYHSIVQSKSSPTNAVEAVKAGSRAPKSGIVPPAQTAPTVPQQNVPLGLLLTISPPTANNIQATADYKLLRGALQSGNLTGAQQAYLRLQSDVLLAYPTQSAPQTAATLPGSHLSEAA
jgi:hypothetical protein